MTWKYLDTDRWEFTADDELHLLLHENGEMRELVVQNDSPAITVHVYLGPVHGLVGAAPLEGAKHVRTWTDRPDTVNRDDRDAWWRWLAEEGYVQES